MPRICYEAIKFAPDKLKKIQKANEIIQEYTAKGYQLTLRQLYYQFVARGIIPNNEREYKKLGDAVADGRLAGLLDWDAITDRMRQVETTPTWASPADIISVCANQFKLPKWNTQPYYVEAWIEKDALVGVIENICREHEIPYMACRGYVSASSIWEAGYRRFRKAASRQQKCLVLYLGDHDPSGIDMTRDVEDRVQKFAGVGIDVKRLALNHDQVEEFDPPPNPTKLTDSRADGYIRDFGHTCWELDALDPEYISNLIDEAIKEVKDDDAWDEALDEENTHKENLAKASKLWLPLVGYMKTFDDDEPVDEDEPEEDDPETEDKPEPEDEPEPEPKKPAKKKAAKPSKKKPKKKK